MKKVIIKVLKYLIFIVVSIWIIINIISGIVCYFLANQFPKPIIEIISLADKVHFSENKEYIVFDSLPEFYFPTNIVVHIYGNRPNCRDTKFEFAFYLPNGGVIIPKSNFGGDQDDAFVRNLSKSRRQSFNRLCKWFYLNSGQCEGINQIPKIRITDCASFKSGFRDINGLTIYFYTIKTIDGEYFCGSVHMEIH